MSEEIVQTAETEVPAQEAVETATPETEETVTPQEGEEAEPQRFTADDLANLSIEDLAKINPALKKNVDKFFSTQGEKSKQEIDQIRQEIARIQQGNQQTQVKPQYRDYKEFYMAEPERCRAEFDTYIGGLKAQLRDPSLTYEDKERVNVALMEAIDAKAELPTLELQRQRQSAQKSDHINWDMNVTRQYIPDFDHVAPQLNEYAIQEFGDVGLTPQMLGVMRNPEIWGAVAQITGDPNIAMIGPTLSRIVHKMYSKANAGKTLKEKENKTPPKTLGPGQTTSKPARTDAQVKAAFEKARQSGNLNDLAAANALKNDLAAKEAKRR